MRHYPKAPRPLRDAPATTSPFIRAPRMMSDLRRGCRDGTVCAVCSVMGSAGCMCLRVTAASQHQQPPAATAVLQRHPDAPRWRRIKTSTESGSRYNEEDRDRAENRCTLGSAERPPLWGRDYIISAADTRSPQRALRGQLQPISLHLKRLRRVYIQTHILPEGSKRVYLRWGLGPFL